MKKTIFVLCVISTLMLAQDAAGSYKLSGVNVEYTYVSRGTEVLTVTDNQNLGVVEVIGVIPGGVPFTTVPMQLPDAALSAIGINLNVTLNEDGSGEIGENSYYPDVNTIVNADGSCTTLQQVLPVSEPFIYTSMGNMMQAVSVQMGDPTGSAFTHPGVNVLGLPGISPYAGQQLGGLKLESSATFEYFPMIPAHPVICNPDGEECFPFTIGDIDGSGTVEVYPDVNLLGIPEYVPGGQPLTGLTGGFWLKEGVNAEEITSMYPGNTDPQFHLEWHGVDGGTIENEDGTKTGSGLGFGEEDCDDSSCDEDGDGTWFDRLLGLPGATATYVSPAAACDITGGQGLNYPIYGDHSSSCSDSDLTTQEDCESADETWTVGTFGPTYDACIDRVDLAASAYLMNPAVSGPEWGMFVTYNSDSHSGCEASGGEDCDAFLGNDSDHDFDGTNGRLIMNFNVPCVSVIEAREVVAEFIEVGTGGCGSGDVNADGSHSILDVIALVNCVLDDDCSSCVGDMNGDTAFTVNDIVALVNCVLNDSCDVARVGSATSAEFNVIGNEVSMTADGIVGGIQMTLSHGSDFALKLTDGGQFSDYSTNGNTTKLIIVNPVNDNLFTTNGDFTIKSVLVSDFSGENSLSASVNMPGGFSISAAYPNPFNPTTQMTLALHTQADVSVKVFNMAGHLVDVITEGQMDRGSYSLTWDGTNASSGVYFVKTQVGSVVQNQKIMFIK